MKCVKCGRRAVFISPIGTMCPTDALLVAAFHDWIPAQIRPEDRLERIPAGYLDAFRPVDDPVVPSRTIPDPRVTEDRPSLTL